MSARGSPGMPDAALTTAPRPDVTPDVRAENEVSLPRCVMRHWCAPRTSPARLPTCEEFSVC